MFTFPKLEKITRDTSVVHFFLMFGYKLFSLYFPLYLVERSFSLAQVGYTNFLIYLPIALFAPVAGYLNHRINPGILTTIGVVGYGIYSLGMILFPNLFVFYILQVILGISASLFFVSARAILMGYKLEKPDRAFAWFYSSPSYADAFAPAVGALFIWKFGFAGVFAFSVIIQALTAIFCFTRLRKQTQSLTEDIKMEESGQNYLKVLQTMKLKGTAPLILTSFLVLLIGGFNNTFFVLFLKNLGWSRDKILIFSSILSLVLLPVSFFIIKTVGKFKSSINISRGSQIVGISTALLGGLSGIMNFYSAFIIMLGQNIGGLMTGSGRSGLLATKLRKYPEESAAVDTIFSPLSTAFGALMGGLIISILGYPLIFLVGGILIFFVGTVGERLSRTS